MAPEYLFVLLILVIAVGLPIVLSIGSSIMKDWLRHKEAMATALNAQAAEKAAQYAAHSERLEQRVRVLERLATDRGADLALEIEQLRDERPLN